MPTRSLYNDNEQMENWLLSTNTGPTGGTSSQQSPYPEETQSSILTRPLDRVLEPDGTSLQTHRHELTPSVDFFDTLISIPHHRPGIFIDDGNKNSWPAFVKDVEYIAGVHKSRGTTDMKGIVTNTTIGGGPMKVTLNRFSLPDGGGGRSLISVMFFLCIEMGRNCTNLPKDYQEEKHRDVDQSIITKAQRSSLTTVKNYLEDGQAREVQKFFGQRASSGWLMYTALDVVAELFEIDFYTFYGLFKI